MAPSQARVGKNVQASCTHDRCRCHDNVVRQHRSSNPLAFPSALTMHAVEEQTPGTLISARRLLGPVNNDRLKSSRASSGPGAESRPLTDHEIRKAAGPPALTYGAEEQVGDRSRADATPACTPRRRWLRREFPGVCATAGTAIRAATSARSREFRPDEQREHRRASGGAGGIGGGELSLYPSDTVAKALVVDDGVTPFGVDHPTAQMPPTGKCRRGCGWSTGAG
jgi:hypothetical protein